MDYEKEYKEALEKARQLCAYPTSKPFISDLQYIFPQLKESEDDRIRKEIIKRINNIKFMEEQPANQKRKLDIEKAALSATGIIEQEEWFIKGAEWSDKNPSCISTEKQDEQILTYIERLLKAEYKKGWDKALLQLPKEVDSQIWQIANNSAKTWEQSFAILCASQKAYDKGRKDALREQKHDDKVEPKFHEGDWVIDEQGIIDQITHVIENVTNHTYGYDTINGEYFNDYTEGVRLWTIQDAKDGDVLCSNQIILLFKQWEDDSDCNFVIAHAGIDISGKLQITDGHWLISNESKPATKEQRDLLFQKMKEAGYVWDADKKELRKIEQQAAEKLSKEQEYTLNRIVEYLEDNNCPEDWKDLLMGIHDAPYIKQKPAEWSEEDKKKLNRIYSILGHAADEHAFSNTCRLIGDKECVELQDWLKTLEDRYCSSAQT